MLFYYNNFFIRKTYNFKYIISKCYLALSFSIREGTTSKASPTTP